MTLTDYITAKIDAAPAALQWVYDPYGLVLSGGGIGPVLIVSAKEYRVLVLRPHAVLRFRLEYERLRAGQTPLVVVSTDVPLAIADIEAICCDGRKGSRIDCSTTAMLASSPPLGTGKGWHPIVDDLGEEFLPLVDGLIAVAAQAPSLNPNTQSDAVRLIVAARMQGRIAGRALRKILGGRLTYADLYALALAWEQSGPGPRLKALWQLFCQDPPVEKKMLLEKYDKPGGIYREEKGKWLTGLADPEARDQWRNFLWTTFILSRYRAHIPAARPGIIGLLAEELWKSRAGLSDEDVCALIENLAGDHAPLFRSLTAGYELWLKASPAVYRQLLVALELAPEAPSIARARQVAEKEEVLSSLFLTALGVIAGALCEDVAQTATVAPGVWERIKQHRKSLSDSDLDALGAFEAIYGMADRLHRLAERDYPNEPEITRRHDLWLDEIYPRYLAGLDLLAARAQILNAGSGLVPADTLEKLRTLCLETMEEFNRLFCSLVESRYLAWVRSPSARPLLTCDLIDRVFAPEFKAFVKSERQSIYLIIFDGMRYDLWQELLPRVEQCFQNRLTLRSERRALSILPSATQYTRKAIFAGDFPADWKRRSNGIDPETSEIRLLKGLLQRRNIPYADRLPEDLLTGSESEMNAQDLAALIEDRSQVIKPLIFNLADDRLHNEDADLETLYQMIATEFQNRIRPILSKIDEESLVIITSDHGFYDVWGARRQNVPGFYGAIRWRYGALRREDARLGYPDDVVAFKSRDIKLNVEYTYPLESTREFPESDADAGSPKAGRLYAYPLYLFGKPGTLLERRLIASDEELDRILQETGIFRGNTRQRYEHGGISLQEMVVPVAVFAPGKKTGRPDVRLQAIERNYTHTVPATLTLKLVNFGSAPADLVRVSVEGVLESRSVERLDPGEEAAQQLAFDFVPDKEFPRLAVTLMYYHEGQQAILTQTMELTVQDQPGKVERRRLF